jgi:hypothetical protein
MRFGISCFEIKAQNLLSSSTLNGGKIDCVWDRSARALKVITSHGILPNPNASLNGYEFYDEKSSPVGFDDVLAAR